ncbi:MAG: hypothetical protein AB7L94_23950 [Kofleriaceae bacterium]
MRSLLSFSFLGTLLVGCSPFDPDLGGVPYKCGTAEPRCPEGYSCQTIGTTEVCVAPEGPGPDGMMSGFQCADDSLLEGTAKNDTIQNAYATPVAQQRNDITLAGVAICPEGDKDNYLIVTTVANSNIEVITSWDSGMPVSVSILNAGGTSINNGTANGENSLRAYAANVPVGQYYANAYAAANAKNNYKIKITVSTQ